MLFWIIQISLLSIIFIFLVHHLLVFFKSTLTIPKIKDLVNSPNQKYQNIFDTLSQKTDFYTDIDLLPSDDYNMSSSNLKPNLSINEMKDDMKDELKSFLKKQFNNVNNNSNYNSNDIIGINSGTSNFSTL